MTVRVLTLVSTLARGGPVAVIFELLKRLDRHRFSPIIACLSPPPATSRDRDFDKIDVPVFYPYGKMSKARALLSARPLRDFIYEQKVDLIHSHGLRADILAGRLRHVTTVSTIHCSPLDDYRFTYGRLAGSLAGLLHLAAVRRINHGVAVSKFVRDRLAEHGCTAQVVCNGVSLADHDETRRAQQRKELSLSEDVKLIAVVGGLTKLKNTHQILAAWKRIPTNFPARLAFVGDGPEREAVESLAQTDGRIILTGFISNPLDVLQAADVYLSASRLEGLPMAGLEAMGCGLPLCLSHIPAHEELGELSSQACYYFKLDDIGATAEAIMKAASFPPGDKNILPPSLNSMTASYEALYLNCMGLP